MKNNAIFMAVKVGKAAEENSFKTYKGVAAFTVLAVNPNKTELGKLINRDIEEEPVYLSKTEEGKTQLRVVFYGRTAPESKVNNGIDLLTPISFILVDEQRVGKTTGKLQIIDKFGRTAWATPEEVQSKSIPQYSSGPANISADYRVAYQGEEFLIDFLSQWLNVPLPATYKKESKKWEMKENLEDSEIYLDMAALFKGDVSELKSLVELAPSYIVKAAVGIKTVETENGTKQYHNVFNRKFLKNSITDYSKLDVAIKEFQDAGGATGTLYSTQPLHENVVEATDFSTPQEDVGNVAPITPWG